MIYLLRHSERIDINKEKWKKTKRYKNNNFDPCLTENGKKIAIEQIKKLLFNVNVSDMDFIYSSPFTRCIETSLMFQKYVMKKYNVNILIRIEYGLSPQFIGDVALWYGEYDVVLKNNKFVLKNDPKIIDDYLLSNNTMKRYGEELFDKTYKSIGVSDDLNNEKSYKESINNRLNCINKIVKKFTKDASTIICTHGEVIMLLRNYLQGKWEWDTENLFGGNNYCGGLELVLKSKKLHLNSIIKGDKY